MNNIPTPHYVSDEEHSKYSPSGSKRWIQCPASINFVESIKVAPKGTNKYSEEGTAAHEFAAYCLENEVSPRDCIGKKFNRIAVDIEMARHVEKYVNYVQGNTTWDSVLWVENRLSLESIHKDMFGTADAIIVSKDSLEVIDLKYGKGVVVEVENNTQLMLYAIGVLDHLEKHGITFETSFQVKCTIVQPRAAHEYGPIRPTYFSIGELLELKEKAIKALEISKTEEAYFGPGEEVCRWCDGAPVCRALAEYNVNIAKLEFEDLVKSPLTLKQELPKINELSEEEIASILKHSKSIENWLNSVVEFATSALNSGRKIPGYKLVYGRSNRAWLKEAEVVSRLEEYGTDLERLYEKKFLSPSKAEKELTDAEWELVKELVYKPTGRVTIASETDGRKEVDRNSVAKDEWGKEDL